MDYVIQPVPIELPLLHPNKTQLTHVACGRAHTVIVTDNEGCMCGVSFVVSYSSCCCVIESR